MMINNILLNIAYILLFQFQFFTTTDRQYKYDYSEQTTSDTIINSLEIKTIKNTKQETELYYSIITMYPCINGECKIMNIKIFWDIYGNYYKFELDNNNVLTKLNHKNFTKREYLKLHQILLDTTSDFRFLKLNELTKQQSENSFYETDAVSGATIKNRDFKCINGAVKTTYQLWRIANISLQNDTLFVNKTTSKVNINNITKQYILNMGVRELSIVLNEAEKDISSNIDLIKEISELILKQSNNKSLLVYNFLYRNKIKASNNYARLFLKKELIKHFFYSKKRM